MNSHRKGIIAFLLIAFGLTWTIWEIGFGLGMGLSGGPLLKLLALPSGFGPAIACFVVRKWVTREGFADAGLRLHLRKWPYYVVGWLLPIVVIAFIVGMALLLGVGKPDFSLDLGLRYLSSIGKPLPPSLPHSLTILVGILLIQAPFMAPILFGEEFGWRGYLQMRLFPAKPVLSAVVTGIIWGLWHLPMTVRGYGFPDHPKIGGFVMYPLFCVIFSIIFGWLVLKTGSIWSSSLAHSSTNVVGGTLYLLLFGGGSNFLYVSYGGLLSMIPLGALSLWIVLTGQLKPAEIQPSVELAQTAKAS